MNLTMATAIEHLRASLAARVKPHEEDGQALVEYSLILALVGLAVLGALGLVTDGIASVFETVIGTL